MDFWSRGNEARNWGGWNRDTGGRDRHMWWKEARRLSVRYTPSRPCRPSWLNSRLRERRAIFKWEPKVVLGISRVSACKCCSGAPSFVWASSYRGFDSLPSSPRVWGLGGKGELEGSFEVGSWSAFRVSASGVFGLGKGRKKITLRWVWTRSFYCNLWKKAAANSF